MKKQHSIREILRGISTVTVDVDEEGNHTSSLEYAKIGAIIRIADALEEHTEGSRLMLINVIVLGVAILIGLGFVVQAIDRNTEAVKQIQPRGTP